MQLIFMLGADVAEWEKKLKRGSFTASESNHQVLRG